MEIQPRWDWFQTEESIIVTVYIPKLIPDSAQCSIVHEKLTINYCAADDTSTTKTFTLGPLFNSILPDVSRVSEINTKKIDIKLAKENKTNWPSLLQTADPAVETCPKNAKKSKDWNQILHELDDEENEGDEVAKFFTDLYKNADDDTKRAMMKSFTESQGTALSTNWKDVASRKYDVVPPEGVTFKKE